MVAKIYSVTLIGLTTQIIEVEVDITRGKNIINIVGLPDKAIQESKERITSALKNSNCIFPKGRITVNLAPADIPKTGAVYDLPIAVGILIASNQIKRVEDKQIFLGELSLMGKLRSIAGVVTSVDGATKEGFQNFFVPADNAAEAALIKDANIFAPSHLNQVIEHFNGKTLKKFQNGIKENADRVSDERYDFLYIKGQEHAKRALEIAAAGGHNCLLSGVPGSGKTYLSRCIPAIMPDLSFEESIEVTRIYSVAGLLAKNFSIVNHRPFRSPTIPHHRLHL